MHLLDTLAILAVALIVAKVLGGLAERVRVPSVLVELIVGVVLGNVGIEIGSSEVVHGLSELGVLFLLFLVGLETDIKDVSKVGVDATVAALAGVLAPFALAFGVIPIFFPDFGFNRTLFSAAALTATSVGITARVLKDTGKLSSVSGKIILSAAVIDDVLGIVVLAIVTALVTQGAVSASAMGLLIGKISLFFVLVWAARRFLLHRVIGRIKPLEVSGSVTIFLLSLCLLAAWSSEKLGLAGIVGAFALGLALDDVHFQGYRATEQLSLEEIMKPVTDFLAPVFFIVMGMGVKMSALLRADALALGGVLVVCAILGKLACGWVVKPATVRAGADRWFIGFGMIPRGEVGLIFAAMGARLGLLEDSHYAAVIMMVVITTLAAPVLLVLRARALSSSTDS